MRNLLVLMTENKGDEYHHFTISVQEANEYGGKHLHFSFHHHVPFESARDIVLGAAEWEHEQLASLLEKLGANVERVIRFKEAQQ